MLTYEELFGDPKDKEDEPLNKTYSSAEELFSMADNIMPPPKREADLSENSPEQEAQRLSNATAYNNFFKEREIKKSTTQLPDGTYITNRKGAAVSIEDFDEEFNLNDLENPDHFLHDEWMERSNRFLNGLGELGQGASVRKTKDVYEYLRDEKWSTTRTIMRAMQNKQWTPQMMEDYRYIRQVFDKAKLGGTNQILEAVKDIGIDLLVDPMNIVTAAASMFTGGLGGAAVQAGAKGVAAMAGKQALAQSVRTKAQQWAVSPTWKGTMQGMSIGMTEGALDGSLINAATQISERQTGLRQAGDNFSVSELGLTTGLGAIFGGTLGGAVSRVGGAIARRGHAKAMGGKDAELPKWVLDEKTKERRRTRPEDIKRFRRATYRYNKTIAATLGKATSRYLAAGESASPTLKKFIELIRYDAYKGLLDEGSVDKAVKTSYNIRREMREGKTRVFADKFLSKVIETGQGMLGTRSFYNIKMDPIANKQLFSLLVGDKDVNLEGLYRRYYNIKPGASKTTMDGELKRHWKRQGRIKLHGQEVAPEVIGAAFHVRRALDNAHTQASFIDVIGKTGKVEGTTSLFNYSKEFVKNYFPRIWIYDALEANRSKLVDLLVKTKHTKLLEGEFPKVKGMLAGRQVDLEFKDGKLQKKNEKGELVNLTAEDQNNIKLVSSFDDTSKKWVIDKNEELDFILTHQEDYDQVTFKTYFKEQGGVKSFIELARNRQPEASEAELGILARRLKGEALVDNMINQKYDLNKVRRDVTSDRTSFSQHRAFSELDDVDLYNLGVIETDVSKVFSDYMHKISSSIERTSLFGNNKAQFAERWQIPIQKELEEAAQKDNPELTRKIIEEITGGPGGVSESSGIMQLYTHVTGIESNYIKNRFAAGVLDGTKVAMRLAYLPLATLSSITEPMIALSRADLADTKPFIKEFSYAAGKQFTKSMNRIFRAAEVGITGKKVTGFKDMSDETWMEFYQAGISAQHAMEDRLQGLYGEYHTNAGRWVSQQFFKYNLLIPWTEAVQMGAYNFSNARITRIIGDLDRGSNFMNQKLSKAAIDRRRKELTQIGIQPVEALKAYREHMTPAITIETTTPTGRAWARYDKKANIIYVNESELVKRYQEKAWTKPKIKGVTPLADDQFKSLDEFRSFIYSHERAHVRFVQRRNETKAQYENRTNREALKNPTGSQAHSTLDDSRWKQSNYYDNSVVPSSSLFAREIILNPAVAEANTPLWFNNPGMQLFVQFMGYPTAFNNIVLKGVVRGIRQNPAVNGAKALAATSLMTGTALLTNMLRSHGESLDLEPSEQVAEAYRRWGGMGPLEYAYRWKQAQKYGGYGAAPILKAGTGPLPGKIIDALQYHQTIGEFIGSTVPGWAALSPAQRRKYREFLRARELPDSWQVGLGLRRAIQPTIVGGKARGFAIGGVVDVANAVAEPDERIDRMTGLPYNVQAGAAFIDAEERRGFANGNLVEKEEIRDLSDKEKARLEVQKNDMYRLLTRDEEEYATLDQTELSMNSKEELEDLEIDQTFYTSLPEDSMKAKLDAYRDSKTLGLKVSERPVDGNVRLSGKIQFQNVLNLNVDEVTPATVEDKLSTIRAGNVLAEPYLADAIIDSIQYQLGVRDAVLEMDDELTKDKEDVVEQSKSFILRHGLLKLGYDAIKYNNGYVLLRENQFMPTEIMSREARNMGGLISTLKRRRDKIRDAHNDGGLISTLKKRRSKYAKGGDPESRILRILRARKGEKGEAVVAALKEHGRLVGEIESNSDPTRVQGSPIDASTEGTGVGRGKYQYEMRHPSNREAQQGALTARNRYKRFLGENELTPTEEDIKLFNDDNPDFSLYSEPLQDDIFYADKALGRLKLDDLASGALSQKDAWLDDHWKGAAEQREAKGIMWDERN